MTGGPAPGFETSYVELFSPREDHSGVREIEIPRIQRDYAQGRAGVEDVRTNFLAALHRAVTGGEPLSLDFIYGDIDETGTFRPLDGQQRLTTLFLLHWYLANRAGRLDGGVDWTSLSYATRPGARDFCQRLAKAHWPRHVEKISDWITDQHWYRYDWRHDPTIQSMLVMLDSIHTLFAESDEQVCLSAWNDLTSSGSAVRFHVLTLPDTGSGPDLYIKMNSRGKPLTEFESFKARFEASVADDRRAELASKLDGPWSDLLWKVSSDDQVDDDFLKYIGFVTEICEWLQGDVKSGPLAPRAEAVFGRTNDEAGRHLVLLFHAFDTWFEQTDKPIEVDAVFSNLLVPLNQRDSDEGRGKLPLFNRDDVNLFRACCHTYGEMRGQTRAFTLGDSLLLYAVLLHRLHETANFPDRLRVLRNLIEASTNELRPANGPGLVRDVDRLIVEDSWELSTLNQRQVADEKRKVRFIAENPELEGAVLRLEDRSLLRGRLAAFLLDPETFERRGDTFKKVMSQGRQWPLLTAVLLTKGDYGRNMPNGYYVRLGSPEVWTWWRELLTEANDADTERTRATLGATLDDIAGREGPIRDRLHAIRRQWLEQRETQQRFDWRYYLVRYDAMREGKTGVYFIPARRLGYQLGMLSTQSILGYYRDPYLHAMCRESALGSAVDDPWFRFDVPRWMRLKASGTELRFVDRGIQIRPPEDHHQAATLTRVLEAHGHVHKPDGTDLVTVTQSEDVDRVDTEDRVQMGAALLQKLVAAQL